MEYKNLFILIIIVSLCNLVSAANITVCASGCKYTTIPSANLNANLNVSITTPANNSVQVIDNTFEINATIMCFGDTGLANCSTVSAYLQYDLATSYYWNAVDLGASDDDLNRGATVADLNQDGAKEFYGTSESAFDGQVFVANYTDGSFTALSSVMGAPSDDYFMNSIILDMNLDGKLEGFVSGWGSDGAGDMYRFWWNDSDEYEWVSMNDGGWGGILSEGMTIERDCDVDDDGYPEFYVGAPTEGVTCGDGNNFVKIWRVYYNGSHFTQENILNMDSCYLSLTCGDGDHDGSDDLYLASFTQGNTGENITDIHKVEWTGSEWTDEQIMTIPSEVLGFWSLRLADQDGDGNKELFTVADGGDLYRIYYNSSNQWNYSHLLTLPEKPFPNSLYVGEADKDEFNEIVIGLDNGYVVIVGNDSGTWEYENITRISYPHVNLGGAVNSIEIHDIDDDGENEIYASTTYNNDTESVPGHFWQLEYTGIDTRVDVNLTTSMMTTTTNPFNCGYMNESGSETCVASFQVNLTEVGNYTFNVVVNSSLIGDINGIDTYVNTATTTSTTTTSTTSSTSSTTTSLLTGVTLNSPTNGTVDYDGNAFLTYTSCSTSEIPNCTLYVNSSGSWDIEQVDTSISNCMRNSFTILSLSNGPYVWNVNCLINESYPVFADANWTIIINNTANYTYTTVINLSSETTTNVSSSESNTTIEITTNESVTDATLSISRHENSTRNATISVPGLSKFITIEASSDLENSMTSALIKMHYTDAEVTSAGITESDLAIYWYNGSLDIWQELISSMDWVYGTGVENVSNYVWANVTHFSEYTIAQTNQMEQIELVLGWNLISLPLVV